MQVEWPCEYSRAGRFLSKHGNHIVYNACVLRVGRFIIDLGDGAETRSEQPIQSWPIAAIGPIS